MKQKLLFALAAITFSLTSYAYDCEIDGIYYNLNTRESIQYPEPTARVTFGPNAYSGGPNSYSGDIVIPSTIEVDGTQYTIAAIDQGAFQSCIELTSVSLPETLWLIDYFAFNNCYNLTSVNFPNYLVQIGSGAFQRCAGLTSITIPQYVRYIGSDAFFGCTGITSIVVDSGNTTYDSRNDCNAIIETSSNTLILGCKNTVIPSGVKTIKEKAFAGSKLKSVTIPSSVTSIGRRAFSYCDELTSITVESGNTVYDSRDNCNAIIETASNTLIAGCKTTIIPNTVTTIAGLAFQETYGLESLTIPGSVTDIQAGAFVNCYTLSTIIVENGNTVYDSRNNCNAIIETATNTLVAGCKTTVIPSSVTAIGDYAFYGLSWSSSMHGEFGSFDPNFTSITIPGSVTSIGYSAFESCRCLTSVISEIDIPFAFGYDAFYGISDACVLYVPKGTRDAYIAAGWTEEVFKGGIVEMDDDIITFADANVKAICVQNWDTDGDGELSKAEAAAVTDISYAFYNQTNIVQFLELKYFTGLTSIGEGAFYKCGALTSVSLPENVKTIGYGAFSGCTNLTSIVLPNSVEVVGENSFYGCSGLTSIHIPENVTSIGSRAFGNCTALTSIYISCNVADFGYYSFYNCPNVTSIQVDPKNPNFDCRDDCNAIIETASNTLFFGCQNTVIPNSVTTIRDGAFSYCKTLKSIDIPSSVTCIEYYAFEYCTNLTTVTMSDNVTSIGNHAFDHCSNLVSINLSSGLNAIENSTFQWCEKLTSIAIPNGVTTIDHHAFAYCFALTSICIPSSVNSIGSSVFYGCNGLVSMKVESGNISYDSRNDCNAIIETATNTLMYGCQSTVIPESVTSIGQYAFTNCLTLNSITIPGGVISIGTSAFLACFNLASVTISNGVQNIGMNAFAGTKISSITLPNSVTSIGQRAFQDCKNLTSVISEIEVPFAFEGDAFYRISDACVLYVPKGTKDAYIAAGWTEEVFKGGIVEMDEGDDVWSAEFPDGVPEDEDEYYDIYKSAWGTGTFTYSLFYTGSQSQSVLRRYSLLDPNRVQFCLFDWFYGVNLIIDADYSQQDPVTGYVPLSVAPQSSGYYNSGYDEDVMVADSYQYWTTIRGQERSPEEFPSYYDELNGRFVLNLTYYISLGYFGQGEEYLQLDGYEPLVEAIGGIQKEDDGTFTWKYGIVKGEHVTEVKYVLVKGLIKQNSPEAADIYDKILNNDVDEFLVYGEMTGEEAEQVNLSVAEEDCVYTFFYTYSNDGTASHYQMQYFSATWEHTHISTYSVITRIQTTKRRGVLSSKKE